ncbi:WG repeat-containing protein [Reichenbachiella versicolor]|uniref:WG repeat-containing protein n=1 Tax=Reichenbachiella versicolor TaxID=1821036 RepID=UPI000D6EAA87|nr:WG repeat-containing protein [Reichenbachiella versicolor]
MRISIIFLLLLPSAVIGQKSRQAIKLLESQEYEKLIELQEKSVLKDSLNPATFYVYARIYTSQEYDAYDIGMAHEYIIKSIDYLSEATEDHLKELERSEISKEDILELKHNIDELAYKEVVQAESIEACELYIYDYADSKWLSGAIELRNRLAFKEASRQNTWKAYQTFMNTYPDSNEYNEAEKRFNDLVYQEKVGDGGLKEWKKFIKEYPKSPYRLKVESKVFEFNLARVDFSGLESFLEIAQSDELKRNAIDVLYSWNKLNKGIRKKYTNRVWRDSIQVVEALSEETIVPVLDEDKFRFVTANTDPLNGVTFTNVAPEYLCGRIDKNLLLVENDSAKIVVNRAGQQVISGNYESIEESADGVVLFEMNSGFGAFHVSGIDLVEPKYEDLKWSGCKYFIAESEEGVGLLDYMGGEILPPKYDDIDTLGVFWVLTIGDSLYLTNESSLSKFDPIANLPFEEFEQLSDEYVIAYTEDSELIINQNLEIVTPENTNRINTRYETWVFEQDSSFLLFDPKSNQLNPTRFHDVQQNAEWIGTNRFGKWSVKPKNIDSEELLAIDSLKLIGHNIAMVFRDEQGVAIFPNKETVEFKDGEKLIGLTNSESSEKHFLVIDRDGKRYLYRDGVKLFATSAKKLSYVTDEFFSMYENGKYGMVNEKGVPILRTKYDAVGTAEDGLVSVIYRGKFGCFDLNSLVLISLDFDEMPKPYANDLIVVRQDGLYGIWDRAKNVVLEPEFEQLQYWTDTTALVNEGGFWGILDIKNNRYLLEEVISFEKVEGAHPSILYRTETGYGVYDQVNGVIVLPVYSDVLNLGSAKVPIYFAEKAFSEAGYNIVVYYNEKGEKLKRAAYTEEQFDRLICD